MSSSTWQTLGQVPPAELAEARAVCHWAAQLPAALGAVVGEPTEDYAHFALTWDDSRTALVGAAPGPDGRAQAALHIDRLHVSVWEPGGEELEAFALEGHGLQEVLERWSAFAPRGLALFEHEIPPHAVAKGAPFPSVERAPLEELSRWYANADAALHDWLPRLEGAGPVRCWPHHFDIATLVSLGGEKTFGVGMSPGDGYYAEPYWYVTPWPYPDAASLPALEGGGKWHTDEWVGAVLTASDLIRGDPATQRERLDAFIESASRASRTLAS